MTAGARILQFPQGAPASHLPKGESACADFEELADRLVDVMIGAGMVGEGMRPPGTRPPAPPAPTGPAIDYGPLDRASVIRRISAALKARSGKAWSVTGGKGTAYGWLRIDAPPKARTWHSRLPEGAEDLPRNYVEVNDGGEWGHTGPELRAELAQLLGLERVHRQGESVPASNDHYREFIDRAEGRTPAKIAEQYWD